MAQEQPLQPELEEEVENVVRIDETCITTYTARPCHLAVLLRLGFIL